MTRTHKLTGWTRTSIGNGAHVIKDETGAERARVDFVSAGSWFNSPLDDRANIDKDRILQTAGEPLPTWALEWLNKANQIANERAREAFRAAMDDADDNIFGRDSGW